MSLVHLSDRIVAWISLHGSIGAGKSTLLGHLVQELERRGLLAHRPNAHSDGRALFVVLPEPVDQWDEKKYRPPSLKLSDAMSQSGSPTTDDVEEPAALVSMLDLFYSDSEQHALVFQMMAFTSRLNALAAVQEALPAGQGPIVLLSERDFYDDRDVFFRTLYEAGKVKPWEWDAYNGLFDCTAGQLLDRVTAMVHVPTQPELCQSRAIQRGRTGEQAIPLQYLETLEQAHRRMLQDFKGHVYVMDEFHRKLEESEMRQSASNLLDHLLETVSVQ